MRRALEVLMFRVGTGSEPPTFVITSERGIEGWRLCGFVVLAREDEIRYADVEEVREMDERRFNPVPPPWRWMQP